MENGDKYAEFHKINYDSNNFNYFFIQKNFLSGCRQFVDEFSKYVKNEQYV